MDTFSGNVPFLSLLEIRENPEFHDLMRMDRAHWPRCLLWRGWLPVLHGVSGACPWAADASQSVGNMVETAPGSYSSGLITEWSVPEGFDPVEAAAEMSDVPDVWTDGCLVLDQVTGVSSSGSGFFSHLPGHEWSPPRGWGHLGNLGPAGGVVETC